jgi:hypothetical protein
MWPPQLASASNILLSLGCSLSTTVLLYLSKSSLFQKNVTTWISGVKTYYQWPAFYFEGQLFLEEYDTPIRMERKCFIDFVIKLLHFHVFYFISTLYISQQNLFLISNNDSLIVIQIVNLHTATTTSLQGSLTFGASARIYWLVCTNTSFFFIARWCSVMWMCQFAHPISWLRFGLFKISVPIWV